MSIFSRISIVHLALFNVLATALALLGALISQYGFGLHPCHLCILQRIPYAIIIALGLILLVARHRKPLVKLLFASIVLLLLAETGIAIYHVGVEQGIVEGTSACGAAGAGDAQSLEDLRAAIMNSPLVSCNDVSFALFGISMAGYNALFALGLLAVNIGAWRRIND